MISGSRCDIAYFFFNSDIFKGTEVSKGLTLDQLYFEQHLDRIFFSREYLIDLILTHRACKL